jgi:molecular chaperone DnaK
VDRTFEIVHKVLADAKLGPRQIDEVLLVGGQTRMPLVQKRLSDFFGKPPKGFRQTTLRVFL